MSERDTFRLSPVHHAIGWPDGLKLILGTADGSSLDQSDRDANAPFNVLDYAVAYGCTDSIRLLLNADMNFNRRWIDSDSFERLNSNAKSMVVEAMIERLEQLFEFSKRNLPAKVFAPFNMVNRSSLDANARALLNALHAEGIWLPLKFREYLRYPKDFWFTHGTLYHQPDMNYNAAMMFFKTGFTNVDCAVEQITPLMSLGREHRFNKSVLNYFRMVEFFINHGARLDCRMPLKLFQYPIQSAGNLHNYQIIHKISGIAWYGVVSGESSIIFAVSEIGRSHTWRGILQSGVSDPCRCACALGGCRPISLALKSSFSRSVLPRKSLLPVNAWDPQNKGRTLELLRKLTYLLDGLEGHQVVEDTIRYLSFTALGLSHTCCHYTEFSLLGGLTYPSNGLPFINLMDLEEVEEIRNEEAILIERLDCLVDQFMKDYQNQQVSLAQFLMNHWQKTIFEELSAKDKIPEPIRQKWEDIGVVIDEARPTVLQKVDYLPVAKLIWQKRKRAYEEWMEGIRNSIEPA